MGSQPVFRQEFDSLYFKYAKITKMKILTAPNFPKFASTVSTRVPETSVSTSQFQA